MVAGQVLEILLRNAVNPIKQRIEIELPDLVKRAVFWITLIIGAVHCESHHSLGELIPKLLRRHLSAISLFSRALSNNYCGPGLALRVKRRGSHGGTEARRKAKTKASFRLRAQ